MDVLQTRLDHRLQITYDVAHRLRLRAQTLGCGGPLRRARRCRGGQRPHLRNRLRYLFQALCLLLARPIHLLDQLLDIRCAVSDDLGGFEARPHIGAAASRVAAAVRSGLPEKSPASLWCNRA